MELGQGKDRFGVNDELSLEQKSELVQSRFDEAAETPESSTIVAEEIILASTQASEAGIKARPICTDPNFYQDPKDFRRELKRAQATCLDLSAATHEMIDNVRVGRSPDIKNVTGPLTKMVESILRHPCAFVWLARLQSKDAYSFSHAVRCAIFSVVFGRRLGLQVKSLENLALGALLCQIGKTKLPTKLLEKRDKLAAVEMERIKGHVDIGVEILKGCENVKLEVIEVVQNHCERFNGTGYPKGKKGDEIPLLARMVGLVDCYDAMTSVRPHTDEILTTSDDIDFLYEQRDVLFQGQLVEEFIQAFGVYPTGTLVELNDGHVALIQAQDESNRLQPEILLVLDENKEPLEKFSSLSLRDYNRTTRDRPLSIKRALSINEFELDPSQLMRKFSGQKRGWAKLSFGH